MKHLIPSQVDLSSGQWGIEVVNLETSEPLLQLNAQQLFIPASLTKLISSAAALHQLDSNFHFHTSVWKAGDVLVLKGGGDPTLKASDLFQFAQEVYDKGI